MQLFDGYLRNACEAATSVTRGTQAKRTLLRPADMSYGGLTKLCLGWSWLVLTNTALQDLKMNILLLCRLKVA